MSKKILICTANYYTSKFQVGSHNYARAFEKLGYEVYYISNPISPLHKVFANTQSLKERTAIYLSKGKQTNNIFYYVPKSLITPQNKFILSTKFIFNNWHKFTTPNLLHLLKDKGLNKVDILWIESPFYAFLLDEVNYKKSIFRLADYSKGFNNSWELFFQKEIEIANRVDKVIYSAKSLKDKYLETIEQDKMQYISNGIDLNLIYTLETSLPKEFHNINSPRVLYVGMIDYWFNVDLVFKSAKQHQNYNFILIGESAIDLSRLEGLANVFILGPKPHKEIAKYMLNSQIGIIPFKRDSFVDCINPIKLYEYGACGLKIVTTKWKEIEDLTDYCWVCEDDDTFIKEIESKSKKNKDRINTWLLKENWKSKALKAIEFIS